MKNAVYERLCRTIEFVGISEQNVELTQVDRAILAPKSESMKIKSEIFKQSKNLKADIIVDTILDIAMNGNIDAMVQEFKSLSRKRKNIFCVVHRQRTT